VILLGDAPYYTRFGFSAQKTASWSLPVRSSATGCSRSSCVRARSMAPGHDRACRVFREKPDSTRESAATRALCALIDAMTANPPVARDAGNPRSQTITAILVALITLMIVRDILVRRWGPATPANSDVTHHFP